MICLRKNIVLFTTKRTEIICSLVYSYFGLCQLSWHEGFLNKFHNYYRHLQQFKKIFYYQQKIINNSVEKRSVIAIGAPPPYGVNIYYANTIMHILYNAYIFHFFFSFLQIEGLKYSPLYNYQGEDKGFQIKIKGEKK